MPHTPEDIDAILRGLNAQEDRSTALVGLALVEHYLQVEIARRLPGLLPSDNIFDRGLAQSFWNKIVLATGLEIIRGRARRDLNELRHIRNDFAHDMNELSFETPRIAERIRRLEIVKIVHEDVYAELSLREKFLREINSLVVSFVLTGEDFEGRDEVSGGYGDGRGGTRR